MVQDGVSGDFMSQIGKLAALIALAALGGCATLTADSTDQLVEVHVVQDNHEITGVGCVLMNQLGQWFVVAPGRVTVARYARPLVVDCKREGIGHAWTSYASRYDAHDLIATTLTTAGIGYVMDTYSGAGFAYPSVLTVIIPKVEKPVDPATVVAPENAVF
jgi:hypothetical protein